MLRKIISIVAAILVLVGGYLGMKKMSQQKAPPQRVEKPTSVKLVETIRVEPTDIAASIPIYGRLLPFEKVDLFSEVSGVLQRHEKTFKEGVYYEEGEMIFVLENEEQRLNILAQKSSLLNAITQLMPDLKFDYPESFSQWQNYLNNFDLKASIKDFPAPKSEKERYFIAARNLYNFYYTIKAQEERMRKYVIYAPFNGIVTQSNINAGTLVRAGQPLGQLTRAASYEMEATVSLKDLKYVKRGMTVKLRSEDVAGDWSGKVRRISTQVDPNTQNVKVFIGASGRGLLEGMYLTGDIATSTLEEAISIPRKLLQENNQVFIIQDSILKLQNVQLIKQTEDKALVKGLENGTQLLGQTFMGAYEGMKVRTQ